MIYRYKLNEQNKEDSRVIQGVALQKSAWTYFNEPVHALKPFLHILDMEELFKRPAEDEPVVVEEEVPVEEAPTTEEVDEDDDEKSNDMTKAELIDAIVEADAVDESRSSLQKMKKDELLELYTLAV